MAKEYFPQIGKIQFEGVNNERLVEVCYGLVAYIGTGKR